MMIKRASMHSINIAHCNLRSLVQIEASDVETALEWVCIYLFCLITLNFFFLVTKSPFRRPLINSSVSCYEFLVAKEEKKKRRIQISPQFVLLSQHHHFSLIPSSSFISALFSVSFLSSLFCSSAWSNDPSGKFHHGFMRKTFLSAKFDGRGNKRKGRGWEKSGPGHNSFNAANP